MSSPSTTRNASAWLVVDVRRRPCGAGRRTNSVTVSSSASTSSVERRSGHSSPIFSPSFPPVATDDDEPGIAGCVLGRRLLIEGRSRATGVVPVTPSPGRGGRGNAPARRPPPRTCARPPAGRTPRSRGRADARGPRAGARAPLREREPLRRAGHGRGVAFFPSRERPAIRPPPSCSTVHEERDLELLVGERELALADLDHRVRSLDGLRRAALPLRVLVPRRCVPAGGARRAGGRARLRGARAHRPRRRLRLARVRARGQVLRRPRRSRAPSSRSTAARTSRSSSRAQGYANLCRLLTAAHAGTRRPGHEDREPLPPSVSLERVAEHSEGLVCLSGCARHGLGVRNPNGTARLASAFGRDRFFVELQRPFERGDTRRNALLRDLAEHLGVETVATGDVHAHHPRRTLLQDVLVAIRCRTSLEGCEPERRGNRESFLRPPEEMLERFSLDRAAAERSGELAARLDVRPDGGARLPLPRLLGPRGAGDLPARRDLPPRRSTSAIQP